MRDESSEGPLESEGAHFALPGVGGTPEGWPRGRRCDPPIPISPSASPVHETEYDLARRSAKLGQQVRTEPPHDKRRSFLRFSAPIYNGAIAWIDCQVGARLGQRGPEKVQFYADMRPLVPRLGDPPGGCLLGPSIPAATHVPWLAPGRDGRTTRTVLSSTDSWCVYHGNATYRMK